MEVELSGGGGRRVGRVHDEGRAERRRLLRDHRDNGRGQWRRNAGLEPPGTSIPGNDGYPVDNLVRTDAPQLTLHGFGYALADGTYANPFYGAHFAKPDTYAFFSDPVKRRTSEPAVAFTATIVP